MRPDPPPAPERGTIEVVLFDVGGVLMGDIIDDKLSDLARRHGLGLARLLAHKADLRPRADLGELSDREFWRSLLAREGVVADAADLDIQPYLELLPGTLDLARELRVAGVRVAILSNDAADMARTRRAAFGFDALFDPVLISSDFGINKPDARIYDLAVERLGVAPGRIVFVDNTPANVEAARARGMHALQFTDAARLRIELKALGLPLA